MPDKVIVAIFWLYQDRVLGVLEERAASEADSARAEYHGW